MNTIKPGSILKLVKKTESTRLNKIKEEEKKEYIEIDDEIYKLLKLSPCLNSINYFILIYLLFN